MFSIIQYKGRKSTDFMEISELMRFRILKESSLFCGWKPERGGKGGDPPWLRPIPKFLKLEKAEKVLD